MNIGRLASYVLARVEVLAWTRRAQPDDRAPCADHLPAAMVPSVRAGDTQDRVLATFDQHGGCHAADPRDVPLFGPVDGGVPRHGHAVQVVLVHGTVRVRKRVVPPAPVAGRGRLLHYLQMDFFLEAAALVRLRTHPDVPPLRTLDVRARVIEVDYAWSRDVRRELAAADGTTSEALLAARFAALVRGGDAALSSWLPRAAAAVVRAGVAPLDMHAGNLLRGLRTGRFYLVDFNFVALRPAPGWRAGVRAFAEICAIPDHLLDAAARTG